MSFFPRISRRTPPVSPFVSPHLLNLKNCSGHLPGVYFDLPEKPKEESNLYYIRRRHLRLLSPSYRTGLVFFAAVLVLSVFGINAVDAYRMAESQNKIMGEQILEEFGQFSENLELSNSNESRSYSDFTDSADTPRPNHLSPAFAFSQDPLSSVLSSSAIQTPGELASWRVYISGGFEAFESFVNAWPKTRQNILSIQISIMRKFARRSLSSWSKVLLRAKETNLIAFTPEQRQPLSEYLGSIRELSSFFRFFEDGYRQITGVLGLREVQRILIFIQDSYQNRPTGGVLSAGLEILMENGDILAWRPFHVREYDTQLRANLRAPFSMRELTDKWTLETSNSSLDASKSAKQIHRFWQMEARSTADLIAIISADALEGLLKKISTSESPDMDNFGLLWSIKTSLGEEDELKSLASTALQNVFQVLRKPSSSIRLWTDVKKLVLEKKFMLYSPNPDIQSKLKKSRATGSFPSFPTNEDFLMISSVNLDFGPTDYWINNDFKLHTAIQEDGSIKHWLRINRKHTSRPLPDVPSLQEISNWQEKTNHSLVTVVVPSGSRLISSDGLSLRDIHMEPSEEGTTWSFRMDVDPNNSESVSITYEAPWTFDTSSVDNYRLHWLKQPGTISPSVEFRFKLPEGLSVFQKIPEEPEFFLNQDRVYAVVAGRNP